MCDTTHAMEITAHTIPRFRLAVHPWLSRALLIAIGVLSVLFALLGQRPDVPGLPATPLVGGVQSWLADRWGAGDAQTTPSWVVILSLLAMLGAAVALPAPLKAEASGVEDRREWWRRVAIGAAILCLP